VISFQFFSRRVTGVAYIDIPCVVAVAEDFAKWWRRGGRGGDRGGGAVYFTRCFVYDFADTFYFILVIIHFDDENSGLWWDFFVGDFSWCTVDTFKRAVVDLFVGLLVSVFPVLIFLPGLVVEAGTCEDRGRWGGWGWGWG
jgi:hypothetical protein